MAESALWRRWYRFLGWAHPGIDWLWKRVGIGNVVLAHFTGRRTGRTQTLFLGVLRVGGAVYLGHPDGHTAWTLNMEADGGGELELRGGRRVRFTAELLEPVPGGVVLPPHAPTCGRGGALLSAHARAPEGQLKPPTLADREHPRRSRTPDVRDSRGCSRCGGQAGIADETSRYSGRTFRGDSPLSRAARAAA